MTSYQLFLCIYSSCELQKHTMVQPVALVYCCSVAQSPKSLTGTHLYKDTRHQTKLHVAVNGFSGTHWYLLPSWKITWASFVSASPRLSLSLSLSPFYFSLALPLNFFFPRWEHFYGNCSPRNNSSWCTCVPDLLMSRTLNANRPPQQPHERLLHVQMLLSFTVDAADMRPLHHRSWIESLW